MATGTASDSRRPQSVPEEVTAKAGRPRTLAGVGATQLERPGVAPDGWSGRAVIGGAASAETEPEPDKPEKPEIIVEVAPEVAPSETEPEPDKPDYGPIVEIAPEIAPSETEPDKPSKPDEGPIVEIAPDVSPSETEPESDRPHPEVIVEIAPDLPGQPEKTDDDQ